MSNVYSDQFNVAFNAGFVTSFVEALTSYTLPLVNGAQNISSTISDNGLDGLTTKSSLGNTGVYNRAQTIVEAGNRGLSTINEFNKINILAKGNGITAAFQEILAHGNTLNSRIADLELEMLNVYGSTAGPTGASRGDLHNMEPNEVVTFFSIWREFNQTLVESSNDFTNKINLHTNAYIGSTGRASGPYKSIKKIADDQNKVGKNASKLADFIEQNKNVITKNGVALPSPPTATQFNAALALYDGVTNAIGVTLVGDYKTFGTNLGTTTAWDQVF
jgi:hypothetical protein